MNLDISILLGLLGGLALFLYGMQMMSAGLEAAAGNRMKGILERLTSNRFLGILVGAGITAVIQSSSATTVMVVGFVNSGMMTLKQAVWIIMGANIGTTITGQLIALDVGAVAPLFAFVGVAMVVFLKKPQIHHYGNILAGLGVLFIGMEMMGSAMEPLREWPAFVNLVSTFSNPVVGILAGAAFTALIQSSSASVGILQALALSGNRPGQRGIRPLRTEHRHLYHRRFGLHRHQPQRQAHHHHPPDVQRVRHRSVHRHLHGHAVDRVYAVHDPRQPGGADCQHAHPL